MNDVLKNIQGALVEFGKAHADDLIRVLSEAIPAAVEGAEVKALRARVTELERKVKTLELMLNVQEYPDAEALDE